MSFCTFSMWSTLHIYHMNVIVVSVCTSAACGQQQRRPFVVPISPITSCQIKKESFQEMLCLRQENRPCHQLHLQVSQESLFNFHVWLSVCSSVCHKSFILGQGSFQGHFGDRISAPFLRQFLGKQDLWQISVKFEMIIKNEFMTRPK